MKNKVYTVTRERAVEIAMNHNCVIKEIAERYTLTELKEIFHQLRINAVIK